MVQLRVDVGAIDSASAATARLGEAMAGDASAVVAALGQFGLGAQHASVASATATAQKTWGQALGSCAAGALGIAALLNVAGQGYSDCEGANDSLFGGAR